jgi:hypothetical protein
MEFHKHIVLKHFFEKLWWWLLCLWHLCGGDSQTFFKRLGPPLAIPKTFERILGPPIFKYCVDRCGSRNGYRNSMCLKEIELCVQNT